MYVQFSYTNIRGKLLVLSAYLCFPPSTFDMYLTYYIILRFGLSIPLYLLRFGRRDMDLSISLVPVVGPGLLV